MAPVELIQRVVMTLVGTFWALLVVPPFLLRFFWNMFKGVSTKAKARDTEPAELSNSMYGKHETAVVADGVKLHYVAKGTGPLMLFLHGFPEFWYSWRFQLAEFSKDYKVVAVDMRGYSSSSKPKGAENYNAEVLSRDVSKLVEALGYEKCTLVAHDWGGAVAWIVAHRYPEIIEKLVVMNCPHPQAFKTNMSFGQFLKSWYIFFFQLPLLPEFLLSYMDFEFIQNGFKGRKMGLCKNRDNITKEDIELFKYSISRTGALTSAINYYRNVWRLPPKPRVKQIPAPTLVVWGENDGALSVSLLKGLERFVPNLTVEKIPGASHWVNQDCPNEVNAAMRRFLAQ